MASNPPTGLRDGVTMRQLGSEVVALDTHTSRVHKLNETASLIFQLKHSGQSPPEIAECLAAAYEVDRETALQHVVTLVTELESIGLLPQSAPE